MLRGWRKSAQGQFLKTWVSKVSRRPIFLHATSHSKVLQGFNDDCNVDVFQVRMYKTELLRTVIIPHIHESVVISSQRTIPWLEKKPAVIELLKSKTVFVVGKQTAALLGDRGIKPYFVSASGFNGLKPSLENRAVTIIGSETLANPSGQYLSQHPESNHLAVYRRTWMDTELPCLPEEVDVVLATSPSIVDGLVKYNVPKNTLILVLGDTTMNHAIDLGFNNVKIGPTCSVIETCKWFVQEGQALLNLD